LEIEVEDVIGYEMEEETEVEVETEEEMETEEMEEMENRGGGDGVERRWLRVARWRGGGEEVGGGEWGR
jgi:hypothetical protein